MAEESPKIATTQETVPLAEEQVVVTQKTESPVPADKESDQPKPNPEPVENNTTETEEVSKPSGDDKIPESGSFKEESTIVGELPEAEKKALAELKQLIQEALNKHEFSAPASTTPSPVKEQKPEPTPEAPAEETNKKDEQVSETESVVAVTTADDDVSTTPPPPPTEAEAEAEQPKEEVEKKETEVAASSVDEDGAKTVEAIEESVVAVASSVPEEPKVVEASSPEQQQPEEVSIWGIPLLADDRTDVILLKFLRARDFKVKEAFTMIKNTIRWRKEFKIEELLLDENLGDEYLEKTVYMHGYDKEGHPVCYNIYGEFDNKEVYKKTFSDEEKRERFLKWRILVLEKSIRKLDFTPGGICTIVQVNDLKNSPGPTKWELRQATKQALQLLQDNYPEFVAKQVFINVPWWYLAVNRMISPFLTQRTKSKFVFAGPSKSAETLLSYIAPEQLSVKYGGLSKDGEFGITDAVTEITVRPAAKHIVEFPVTENCLLSWELRVIGWDISYGAEFVPSSEGSYTVIIQKTRKIASSEEPVLCNNYKIGEPGKVVLTIDNSSSKKKKLLYRLKTKPSTSD
ncbi:putative cellular retinaldehyde binding/alpha-tocopherol transport, GOLD domain, CRAL/TRIO [Medicago truncatula]|uniref:Patellin-3 protein n=1 Tax=Medicago truncatula TaxID=3880 RepID=A0A072V1D5_MEDTR|nr:patellin-3 [Medicago truncatula]KEH35657.1 patellin-3 protein [Medicago truncatula]RHN70021.1 putative cellular retinaldehyde binding/alpha-tocopherol transport, GOLD domain, CRAL/TRIO [Medicago truncatula]